MLRWHRLCAILALPLLLYVAVTGAGIEMWDMIALVSHAPPTDRNMLMMRQHIYGPSNYAVVSAPDYTAPALPAGLDYVAGIQKAASLGRAAVPGAELRLVELRGVAGRLAGHVQMGSRQLIFDLATGKPLPASALPPPEPGREFYAPRAAFKALHRFNYLGQPGTLLNAIAGIALVTMIVTGLLHYLRLYKARARMGRTAPFWPGGSVWRKFHRWASLAASILVLWISLSGLALAIDNVTPMVVKALASKPAGPPTGPNPADGDLGSPLTDAQLPGMTSATLAAFKAQVPNTGLKVLRLRYFVGYAQGVVVAANAASTQYVFNTATGASMSMHEVGYPDLGFPTGWEWHQRLKRIHRGDIFGMPGRWLDSLGALALLYLLLSGAVMYAQLWQGRARSGRTELIWK